MTILLANTSIASHNYHFFFDENINSFSNFQGYNMVFFTIITMLYIESPKLTNLIIGGLYPLTNIFLCGYQIFPA